MSMTEEQIKELERKQKLEKMNEKMRQAQITHSSSGNVNHKKEDNTNKRKTTNIDNGGHKSESYATMSNYNNINSKFYKELLHSHNIYTHDELKNNIYWKTFRFGVFNPVGTITNAREFLFFTKPDLNISKRDDGTGLVDQSKLNPALSNIAFWEDLFKNRQPIVNLLQSSFDNADPFNHLLQNQVISNLEIPGLSSNTIETATNMYGVGFSYRGSSESSNDTFDFSLEFRDTKWLDVYYYFRAYDEYETLKHHGVIRPYKYYIENKILHDQISIYKFITDEDMESIIYYGKFYGVMPKSLPREVFSSPQFDNGLSYSIDFRAAFYEDMMPEILDDFNELSKNRYNNALYRIDIYNDATGTVDNRPALAAYVEKEESKLSPTGFRYKLRWRGDDKY